MLVDIACSEHESTKESRLLLTRVGDGHGIKMVIDCERTEFYHVMSRDITCFQCNIAVTYFFFYNMTSLVFSVI